MKRRKKKGRDKKGWKDRKEEEKIDEGSSE